MNPNSKQLYKEIAGHLGVMFLLGAGYGALAYKFPDTFRRYSPRYRKQNEQAAQVSRYEKEAQEYLAMVKESPGTRKGIDPVPPRFPVHPFHDSQQDRKLLEQARQIREAAAAKRN